MERRRSLAARRPVVFLDLDGVLVPWEERTLDARCVAHLNDLVTETGARVVLSSSWRETMSLAMVADALRTAGASFALDSATPIHVGASRGEEIAAWLAARRGVSRFVILDDQADVRPYVDRLVLVDGDVGLTQGDAARARALLEG